MGSVAKRCESVNTLVSLIWWLFGFYWVVAGGNILMQNAPSLYWYDFEPYAGCTSYVKYNFCGCIFLSVACNVVLLEGNLCQLLQSFPPIGYY